MGLDFTNIPDRTGSAVYILHRDLSQDLQKFDNLQREMINLGCNNQVFLIPINSRDGENIRDFYDILPEQLPAILLIRDDDSLIQQWVGIDIPPADIIVHYLTQTI